MTCPRPAVASTTCGLALCLASLVRARCRGDERRIFESQNVLDGDVARVGDMRATSEFVAAVAEARGVAPAQALDFVLDDIVLAQAARRRGLDRAPGASWASAAALAGRISAHIGEEAMALGPPTPDERGTRRVIHAVVLRSDRVDEERAIAIADAIESAAAGASSDEEFEHRAAGGAARGRPSRRRAPRAVRRGRPLAERGQPRFDVRRGRIRPPARVARVSPVLRTSFGWHVIRRLDEGGAESEAPPPDVTSDAGARSNDDVVRMRALQTTQSVLRARRAKTPVTFENGVDSLLAQVFGDSR